MLFFPHHLLHFIWIDQWGVLVVWCFHKIQGIVFCKLVLREMCSFWSFIRIRDRLRCRVGCRFVLCWIANLGSFYRLIGIRIFLEDLFAFLCRVVFILSFLGRMRILFVLFFVRLVLLICFFYFLRNCLFCIVFILDGLYLSFEKLGFLYFIWFLCFDGN